MALPTIYKRVKTVQRWDRLQTRTTCYRANRSSWMSSVNLSSRIGRRWRHSNQAVKKKSHLYCFPSRSLQCGQCTRT